MEDTSNNENFVIYSLKSHSNETDISGDDEAAVVMKPITIPPSVILYNNYECFIVIITIVCLMCFAQCVVNLCPSRIRRESSFLRYMLEYTIIVIFCIVSLNVGNWLIKYFLVVFVASVALIMWRMRIMERATYRMFKPRRRPTLTILRSSIYLMTAVTILAVDFNSFHRRFRKSRSYGGTLMDMGIGLYVFSMGCVSRRPQALSDILHMIQRVGVLFCLGTIRTVAIIGIEYPQDDYEYGLHMNAFFTLAFTKLFGTIISAVARTDNQLLPLGLGTIIVHELGLTFGIAHYVLNENTGRLNIFSANREGLCPLPGFVGIYIMAMYVSGWLPNNGNYSYAEYMRILKKLSMLGALLWVWYLLCVYAMSVARVLCNMGYASWIIAFSASMLLAAIFLYDLLLTTLFPPTQGSELFSIGDSVDSGVSAVQKSDNNSAFPIPILLESINFNGLFFFILTNMLTGVVNMIMNTSERNNKESIEILVIYMLIATFIVYVLHRLRIRIA